MARVIHWDDETAQRELSRKLAYCREARRAVELEWEECDRTLLNTQGAPSETGKVSFDGQAAEDGATEGGTSNVGINYAFKNYRFIHSQLSANPPSVVARPTSNDPSDRQKADSADRLIRFAVRKYSLQELMDLCSANTLGKGTGIIKTVQDAEKGAILDFDKQTGEMLMEGDIAFTVPSPEDIWFDPDARLWTDVKYVFERILMPFEEALFRFGPEMKETLQKHRLQEGSEPGGSRAGSERRYFDVVEVFQYWETGLPYNGMVGRFCYCTLEGKLLTPVRPNPFRFASPKDRGVDMPDAGTAESAAQKADLRAKASLPYNLFTDIDIPGRVWGRSHVLYEAPLQDLYNRLINLMVDNVQAHGVARLLVPEGCELADDAITDSPMDIIKFTGNVPPSFQAPMALPAAIPELIQMAKNGIDDMAGVNEAMMGKQSREQSGFSMQYATNQGNMIRRRLFNKYVLLVESVYKAFLNLVVKHWDEKRVIYVLGKEKAFEAIPLKGSDIDGGYDLVVEYGASLSLDPTTRREEIITLLPLFEKAGVDTRTVLSMLKLNELEGIYDNLELASTRQREDFQEMISLNKYLPPRASGIQDHKNRLAFAYQFVETSEFKYLPEAKKQLIEKHIEAREVLAAKGATPQGAPAPAAGGPPAGPLPAVPGAGGPLDVMQQGPAIAAK